MVARALIAILVCGSISLAQPAAAPGQPRVPTAPGAVPAATVVTAKPGELAHIETSGTGPIHVILIPGLSCDWTVWRTFMDRNKDRYTMHAVTLPGFGHSAPPARPEGTPVWKDLWLSNAEQAIVKAADDLKLERPVVVGHSMGAHLAIRLAVHHPGRFAGAVAVDGYAAFPIGGPVPLSTENRRALVETQMSQYFDRSMGADRAAGLRTMYRSMVTDPKRGDEIAAMAEAVPVETAKTYFLELLAGDLINELKTNKTPLLMLAAEDKLDENAAEGQKEMRQVARTAWTSQASAAANTALIFIENSRHFVMDDQPQRLDDEISRFSEMAARKPAPTQPAGSR